MEKAISSEERIRRAEEIYNRRRMQTNTEKSYSANIRSKEKINLGLFKKMFLQIVICLLIYLIFYLIKNESYVFSEDVINKTREFLSYDINFQNTYNYIVEYYNKNINWGTKENREEEEYFSNEQVVENTEVINEIVEDNNQNNLDGIGGGIDENVVQENVETSADVEQEEVVQLSQMEIDANEIKQNYSFALPLKGTISSRYGPREPTEIVSANHEGIDIAVNEGTVFVCAMEGIATKVISSATGYGNHIYIENGDDTTIYAHCKTIYIKEGATVKQGEKIGEVGETGNATGPHLHFEIRKSGRIVNPEYILEF